MKILKNKEVPLRAIIAGILSIVWFYVNVYFTIRNKIFIGENSVTCSNIIIKFAEDYFSMLFIPTILIILWRKHLSDFRLCYKSKKEIFFLCIVIVVLFFLNKDFTLDGFYKPFFYIVVIAFGEEFFYRGFLYNRLKGNSEVTAIIISGILWGVPHAILPTLQYNFNIHQFLILALSKIGMGITMGWYFIYLQEKSKTLWVPILVHAILDYSVGCIGFVTSIGMFAYFLLKSRKEQRGQKSI